MDKETIHEQIEILIETLKEQHEGMKGDGITNSDKHTNPDKRPNYISQIDIDLFLENIRDLYEFSVVLGKMNDRDRKQVQSPQKEVENNYPLRKESPVEIIAEPIVPLVGITNPDQQVTKSSPKEKKVNKISSGVLFEDFSSVIEDIKPKDEPIILQNEAISDLKIAIGINEKFIFMNELFDGSLEEYNASLDLLNNCQNASEAEQEIFLGLQPKYHWDMNKEIVKKLLALVKRRFKQ